jgi:hypothetical protein
MPAGAVSQGRIKVQDPVSGQSAWRKASGGLYTDPQGLPTSKAPQEDKIPTPVRTGDKVRENKKNRPVHKQAR